MTLKRCSAIRERKRRKITLQGGSADGKKQIYGTDGAAQYGTYRNGNLCENALEKVANALENPTDEVSRDIIILSKKTEEKERELENICINLLLKQQPVASDLRQISSALKMVTDMRRIGEVQQYCRNFKPG